MASADDLRASVQKPPETDVRRDGLTEETFTLTVTGVTREEYLQGSTESARRAYRLMAGAAVIICILIEAAAKSFTLKGVFWPLGIYVAGVLAWNVLVRVNYKGQLDSIDPVTYEFDAQGWSVTVGESRTEVAWARTPMLRRTKACIFVYNSGTTSNMLPRRLLTPEREQQLFDWFQASRAQAKAYQKEQEKKDREEFRKEYQSVRITGRGPAWGPFRRKK